MNVDPAVAAPRAPSAAFGQGLRAAAGLPAVILAATFVGIGSVTAAAGLPLAFAVLATALIWAGPAQLILVGGLAAGAAWIAMAIAVTLSSVRLLPMVVSLVPYLRSGGARPATLLICVHMIAISLWVEGLKRLPDLPPEERAPFFLGLASGYVSTAVAGTIVGHTIAGVISAPFAAGLLFLTPIFFLLSLFSTAKGVADHLAVVAGFFGLLAAATIGDGLELLWAGVGGGTLAYGSGRLIGAARAS